MITKRFLLEFSENEAGKPITSYLVKNYDVEVNIIHANINYSKSGHLIVDITGNNEKLEGALAFLKQNNVSYKTLEKSVVMCKDKCVECGACAGVCPTQAITFNKDKAEVTYNENKCILCRICVKTCPLRAISIEEWE